MLVINNLKLIKVIIIFPFNLLDLIEVLENLKMEN